MLQSLFTTISYVAFPRTALRAITNDATSIKTACILERRLGNKFHNNVNNEVNVRPAFIVVTDIDDCRDIPLQFCTSWSWRSAPCTTAAAYRTLVPSVHHLVHYKKFSKIATSNFRSSYMPAGEKSNWELISRKVDVN